MTIDPQYNVGFSWARQFGFRVTKRLFDKYWLGAYIENAQTLFSASGQAQNFLLGSAGASGGLYNPEATYSFNSAPDFVFKAAAEPGFGHFEIFGIIRRFRDRVYPNAAVTTPSALGAYSFSTATAGYGANARVSLLHEHIDVGGHFSGWRRHGTLWQFLAAGRHSELRRNARCAEERSRISNARVSYSQTRSLLQHWTRIRRSSCDSKSADPGWLGPGSVRRIWRSHGQQLRLLLGNDTRKSNGWSVPNIIQRIPAGSIGFVRCCH